MDKYTVFCDTIHLSGDNYIFRFEPLLANLFSSDNNFTYICAGIMYLLQKTITPNRHIQLIPQISHE